MNRTVALAKAILRPFPIKIGLCILLPMIGNLIGLYFNWFGKCLEGWNHCGSEKAIQTILGYVLAWPVFLGGAFSEQYSDLPKFFGWVALYIYYYVILSVLSWTTLQLVSRRKHK